jgi:CBS domain containing-hemolysin-like protein
VDFGDTLVREVMTPRPDIVAIHGDATLDELRALFRNRSTRASPCTPDTSTTSSASSS